jgi:antitoxin VapB
MALSIKSQETERLARLVAKQTGETLTGAIEQALKERLERLKRRQRGQKQVEHLLEIANRVATLPRLDNRSPDEILGYDENGLPH